MVGTPNIKITTSMIDEFQSPLKIIQILILKLVKMD